MPKSIPAYLLAGLSMVLLTAAEAHAGAGRAGGASVSRGTSARSGTSGAKTVNGRPVRANIMSRIASRSNAILYARNRRAQMLNAHLEANGYAYQNMNYTFQRAIRREQNRQRREAAQQALREQAAHQFRWLLIANAVASQKPTTSEWLAAVSFKAQPFGCEPSSNNETWQAYTKRCQSTGDQPAYLAIVHSGCYAPARETVAEFSRRCVLTPNPNS